MSLFAKTPWYNKALPKTPAGFLLAGLCLAAGELLIPALAHTGKYVSGKVIAWRRGAQVAATTVPAPAPAAQPYRPTV